MLQELKELSHAPEKLREVAETLNGASDHIEKLEERHLFKPKPPPDDSPPLPDPVESPIFRQQ